MLIAPTVLYGMLRKSVVLCLMLVACDSPRPELFRGSVTVVQIAAIQFRVYMQNGGNSVEAHRISFETLPSLVLTLDRGVKAIEIATGCNVVPGSLRGDQAIVLAEVDCILP